VDFSWAATLGNGLGALAGLGYRILSEVEPDCAFQPYDGATELLCDGELALSFKEIYYVCDETGLFDEGSRLQQLHAVASGIFGSPFPQVRWAKVAYLAVLYFAPAVAAFMANERMRCDVDATVKKKAEQAEWMAYCIPTFSLGAMLINSTLVPDSFGAMIVATGLGLAGTAARLSGVRALHQGISLCSLGLGVLGAVLQLNSVACHQTTTETAMQALWFAGIGYASHRLIKAISS
jgi:hypothetical protein